MRDKKVDHKEQFEDPYFANFIIIIWKLEREAFIRYMQTKQLSYTADTQKKSLNELLWKIEENW